MKKILLFSFFLVAIIYFFSSPGPTPYDYFTRLSDSFLQGKYYLEENPPWLNELIPAGGGKYYVAYPPMPAVLSMPFRSILGKSFHQEYLAFLLGSGITVTIMAAAYKIKKSKLFSIWAGVLVGIGSIVWFLSSVGSSWYVGQVSAAFFLSGAIYETLYKKRAPIVGILLGAAYMSRLQTILSFPFFLYMLYDKEKWFKNYFCFALGVLPFLTFNFYYNFIRFGSIFDKGYLLIPNVLEEPWYQKGLFHPSYIPNNLRVMFASLPKISNAFPYITPSWAGLSIWITTPAFMYALKAPLKDKVVKLAWLSITLIALVVLSHGTTGFAQFGYRFALDFYPFLILLTLLGIKKDKLSWRHWMLLVLGVIVNLWGVLWINKFGWVSF